MVIVSYVFFTDPGSTDRQKKAGSCVLPALLLSLER